MLPTPAVAYLTKTIGVSTGIMVTASHNPPEYNGIKLFNAEGMGYSSDQEHEIENIFFSKKFRKDEGSTQTAFDLRDYYFENLIQPIGQNCFSHKFKVVVDPGNGAASVLATNLFYDLGLDVIPINDSPDGSFPGRAPEPREDTLKGTYELLLKEHADLAICFDGDADRVVFLDEQGFIGFDESITFLAALAVKSSNKKMVATTVETGKLLDIGLQELGGKVVRGTVGDMPVSYLTRSENAAIGVEPVGVYIMPEAGFYPNSFLAAVTLIKNINNVGEIRSFFKNLPKLHKKQLKIPCSNNAKFPLMKKVLNHYNLFGSGEPNTLDGLRMECSDSWTLIRPSGTEPIIRISAESLAEAKTQELLDQANMAITGLMRD
jgi:phosphoglucosamine mutase